ncbi:MAG: TPM domain-containing protein [Hyphomicrobiaceae bacterium]|nr:TPM domain-containing protein [Hyphomicrobiaceae bacterium]
MSPLTPARGTTRFSVGRALALAAAVVLAATAVLTAFLATDLSAGESPPMPKLTGRIVDNANLIGATARAELDQKLAALEEKSTDQLVVVTLPTLHGYAIEDYGYRLGRYWQIGQQGKDNGAILIVAPNERKVRIEVGRGLEPHLTDAMSRLIIENAILPRFRRGDFEGGIVAGVRDIQDVMLGDAEAVKERAKGGARNGSDDTTAFIILLVWLGIFILIIYLNSRGPSSPTAPGQRRRGGFSDRVIVIPGGSSDWSGGGWSSGGGGFSGGGGDFGGGGASGGW